MISSENAVLFSYALWLVGRIDFGLDLPTLRTAIARWFFMAHTTGATPRPRRAPSSSTLAASPICPQVTAARSWPNWTDSSLRTSLKTIGTFLSQTVSTPPLHVRLCCSRTLPR